MDTNTTIATPLPPAPFGADDPRMAFGKAVALGTAVIGRVTPDQLDGATPCEGMAVRDLLSHLVGVLQRVTTIGRGEDPMATAPHVAGVPDDGWADAWASAAHGVMEAWTDDAVLAQPVALPWRTATAGEQLLGYCNEVSVHTWDLARATGQRPAWDDDVLAKAFDAIRANLPADHRTEMFEEVRRSMPEGIPFAAPFGERVPVPDDAPLIDQLVAYNGRTPA